MGVGKEKTLVFFNFDMTAINAPMYIFNTGTCLLFRNARKLFPQLGHLSPKYSLMEVW